MSPISNILKYKGKPLADPVTLHTYELDTENDWAEFQRRLKKLRGVRTNRRTPIVQEHRTLITPRLLDDDEHGSLKGFKLPVTITAHVDNEHERQLLRRVVGESIATRLRNYPKTFWLVEEVGNAVFDVSDPVKVTGFGELEVFQGFRYAPLVLKDGQVGVIVDPKHKFRSRKTLRGLYDEGVDPYALAQQAYTPFVDACPVEECPEKLDPFSSCRLAGTGKSLYLENLLRIKPSDADPSIIKYSREFRVCLQTPRLADAIRDVEPVAQMRFSKYDLFSEEREPYSYPLERIRIRPSFRDMEQEERRKLMAMIQPKPAERFELTEYFGNKIGRISIPGLPDFVSIGFRDVWRGKGDVVYNRIDPSVAEGRSVRFPSRVLPVYGPADIERDDLNVIPLALVWNKLPTMKQKGTISALFGGKGKIEVPKFADYIKGRSTEIVAEYVLDGSDGSVVEAIVSLLKGHPNLAVLLGCSYDDEEQAAQCSHFTKQLVLSDIPKQGFNVSLLEEKARITQRPYFRNIYLGLYTKVGGQPWSIPVQANPTARYIGYSSIVRSGTVKFALCSYSNRGLFLEGSYDITDKETHGSRFQQSLTSLISDGTEKCYLIVRGGLYNFELSSITEFADAYDGNLLVVECVDTPLRIYEIRNKRAYGANIGSGMFISDTEVGLVTTGTLSGTPSPILLRMVLGDQELFRKSIQSILNLTECYTGYSKASIKHPVPIHASSSALDKAQRLELDSFVYKVAWFV